MVFRFILIFTIFVSHVTGVSAQVTTSSDRGNGREYFVGTTLGQPLFTVNLVNGVAAPGVYHVPVNTNIAELFAYAGGLTADADLNNIRIRSINKGGESIKNYDFAQALKNTRQPLMGLNDRDIVQVELDKGLDTTLKWMSLGSMAASILTAIIVIEDRR